MPLKPGNSPPTGPQPMPDFLCSPRFLPVLAAPCFALFLALPLLAQTPKFALGRTPTPDEIKPQDISVAPNGAGLPPGSGTAALGREIYTNRCARCHGDKGE